jgi:hypothetical protein
METIERGIPGKRSDRSRSEKTDRQYTLKIVGIYEAPNNDMLAIEMLAART